LVAQRVYGLALGYEDLNDHEGLRPDPLLAVLVEKADPTGGERRRERDPSTSLAGQKTKPYTPHPRDSPARHSRRNATSAPPLRFPSSG
jgi:hypothetical protein